MRGAAFLLCVALLLPAVCCAPVTAGAARTQTPPKVITSDTRWSGAIDVKGEVTVQKGATLTIAPGTVVKFSDGKNGEQGGLKIFGTIIAKGVRGRRIVFTSDKKTRGAWNEIFIQHAGPSVISRADFRHATWGLHVHFTKIEISHCLFTGGVGGMRFRSGPMLIRKNLFIGNHFGLRAYFADADITGNTVTGNKIGIFVSQGPEGLKIHGNNIYGNKWYNLRIGDFEPKTVNVSGNWWGSVREKAIKSGIYDKRRYSQVGLAVYEPFLAAPAAHAPAAPAAQTDENGGRR